MTTFPFPFPLPETEIQRRRASILISLCSIDDGFSAIPVRGIQIETLERMLALYDELFFCGMLKRALGKIEVSLSPRLTSAAGKFICVCDKGNRIQHAEIRMSSDFLLRLNAGPFHLNGLDVSTPQEAFLVVFEHELCHALETVLYGRASHSKRFLRLANGLFGHTDIHHSLPTRSKDAAQMGFSVGAHVHFSHAGKALKGVISYIGKEATVMVPNEEGDYMDECGRRFTKYRLPVSKLSKD